MINIFDDKFILIWTKWTMFFFAGYFLFGIATLQLPVILTGFFSLMFQAIVRNMADRPRGN